ncbi:unnamed protein product [Phytophthora fragariaefolia]|uniref:Unnamed protein product n=1 Tax=Phytophthora fragariaefolia TaxID=1490495 RepID=A0A9W6X8B1_9STRA|nr:unnamed protein product [Phytophthora fragariaefolia]
MCINSDAEAQHHYCAQQLSRMFTAQEALTVGDSNGQLTKPAITCKSNKRRAKGSGLPYSTDLQRRRNAELKQLRLAEQQLRVQLNLLRECPATITTELAAALPEIQDKVLEWRKRAITNCEDRVRAQRKNKEFKRALRQQFKLFESIRKELSQSGVLYGLDFLNCIKPTADRPLLQVDFSKLVLDELACSLTQMYVGSSDMVPTAEDNQVVTFHSRTRLDDSMGLLFETTSVTPLACTVREAGDILWRYATNNDGADNEKAFNCVGVPQGTALSMCLLTRFLTWSCAQIYIGSRNIHFS